MLTPIVYTIYEDTEDRQFVKDMMEQLENEFQFWETNRKFEIKTNDGESYKVYFYRTGTFGPRPESMREDLKTANGINGERRRFLFQVSHHSIIRP
jgi:hypothetical protein